MSEPSSASPAPTPARKSRATLYATLGATLAVGAIALSAWVEGSIADEERHNPERAADGIVCQLYDDGAGHRPARCAMIIEAPVERVSAVVRDYDSFPETFDSNLGSIELEGVDSVDEQRVHLTGRVTTMLLGDWPIDVTVTHEDLADGSRTASWEQTEGNDTNRGRWVVEPVPGGARLVYELEVQVSWAPTFLVNDVLLTQLSYPLRRVADRVDQAG